MARVMVCARDTSPVTAGEPATPLGRLLPKGKGKKKKKLSAHDTIRPAASATDAPCPYTDDTPAHGRLPYCTALHYHPTRADHTRRAAPARPIACCSFGCAACSAFWRRSSSSKMKASLKSISSGRTILVLYHHL